MLDLSVVHGLSNVRGRLSRESDMVHRRQSVRGSVVFENLGLLLAARLLAETVAGGAEAWDKAADKSCSNHCSHYSIHNGCCVFRILSGKTLVLLEYEKVSTQG